MGKDRFDIKEKEGISLMTDAVVIVDEEAGVKKKSIIYLLRRKIAH